MAPVNRELKRWKLVLPSLSALLFPASLSGVGISLARASDNTLPVHYWQRITPEIGQAPHLLYAAGKVEERFFTPEEKSQPGPLVPLESMAGKQDATVGAPSTDTPTSDTSLPTSISPIAHGGDEQKELSFGGALSELEEDASLLEGNAADMPETDTAEMDTAGTSLASIMGGLPWETIQYAVSQLGTVVQRASSVTRPSLYSQSQEESGQKYVAKLMNKSRMARWWQQGVKRVRDILGPICPDARQTVALVNGQERRDVSFVRLLQTNNEFVDMLIRERGMTDWVGRLYKEQVGQPQALSVLENDFAVTKMAPADEAIEVFRHRLRLDIPTELYVFENIDAFIQSPDGDVFLNAVSRRPVIRANVEALLPELQRPLKGHKALLSISQQAVRSVANLNTLGKVHTNINPSVFLVTDKGLVFLSGLYQVATEGALLTQQRSYLPGFMPPEFMSPRKGGIAAYPAQDAWQLGMTLFRFWCGDAPINGNGALSFTDCNSRMPSEMKDLIESFTQLEPISRLLPESAVYQHPAMLLPIIPGPPPRADIDQNDDTEDIE